MPPSHPFFAYVEAVKAAGLSAGCSAAPPMFCPDADFTRSQAAIFFVKGLGFSAADAGSPLFLDVLGASAAHPYVQAAADAGLVTACDAGSFCPSAPAERTWTAAGLRGTVLRGL